MVTSLTVNLTQPGITEKRVSVRSRAVWPVACLWLVIALIAFIAMGRPS